MPPVRLADLRRVLASSWSPETAYASSAYLVRGGGHPARGQCGTTALVVQDWLGGKLMEADLSVRGDKLGVHYWNRLPDGTEVDLTSGQLLADEELGAACVVHRRRGGPGAGTSAYLLLASRVRAGLGAYAGPVNAVERYLAATRAGDRAAALAELAPDVVMRNPATDDPIQGRDAVAAALGRVSGASDTFRHTHLLASTPDSDSTLYALVFRAEIGDEVLGGVDLVELDDQDRIATFTVAARPISALMALGARMPAEDV